MSVVNVKSPSVKELTSPHTTEFTLENSYMNVVIVGNPLVKVIASGNTGEFTLVNVVSVVNVGNV